MDTPELRALADALSNRYRFGPEIGRGGFGVVYRAEDLRHRRTVAIKVLIADAEAIQMRQRFQNEIVLAANLVHPHIVPVFDSGEVGDALFFVMPFVDGDTLADRLHREGALRTDEALRIAREVAEALSHAHAANVIHRDIKPANILLASGNALVVDFGIARAVDASARGLFVTLTHGLGGGTMAYMSPEQWADSSTVDGRTDVYSLGCVLYEMLAGHPPFEARSAAALRARHSSDPVPPLRSVRPNIAPSLEALVEQMLAKEPADRMSAGELVERLAAVGLEESGSGPHPRPRTRGRNLLIAGLLGVTGLAGTLVARPWSSTESRARGAPDTTVLVLFPLEGDSTLAPDLTARLRRAMTRWSGLTLVDAFEVRDAVGDEVLSNSGSQRVARELGAGRFIRGTVSRTASGVELSAILSGSRRDDPTVGEVVERLSVNEASQDSVVERVAWRLLLRRPPPAGSSASLLSTSSLPALQHYLRGRAAVLEWALDSAESAFEAAWNADEQFVDASRWLATVRYWLRREPNTWKLFAHAALRDSVSLHSQEHSVAAALVAFAEGDVGTACAEWDGLTRRAPLDFAVWYSAALCHDRDFRIVPDASSPSGWRFRSSYQVVVTQYLQAFQLMPNAHRALRDDSFERVRVLLGLGGNNLRLGRSADDREVRLAHLWLLNDTLAYIPYPAAVITRADTAYAALQRVAAAEVIRRQRLLFRDLSAMWSSSDPASAEAREALSLALQLLGDASALDTLDRAVALTDSDQQRLLIGATEVWVRLRFALPDDRPTLRRVRILADSIVQLRAGDEDLTSRLSIAALTGRVAVARALSARLRRPRGTRLPDQALGPARALELLAAFGGSPDSIEAMARLTDSIVRTHADAAGLPAARSEAFTRAARLAWTTAPFESGLLYASSNDPLVPVLRADVARDTAAVRRGIEVLRALRRQVPPRDARLDAVLVEATLLAKYEGAAAAIGWLDESLQAQRDAPPESDPVNAATLVRAMVYRADLAAVVGDPATARRWAAAVVALWENADPMLQSTVRRMRALAR